MDPDLLRAQFTLLSPKVVVSLSVPGQFDQAKWDAARIDDNGRTP
jgi:hypothetical protein